MFQDSFIRSQKNFARKAWALPISFAIHALLVAVLVVLPLLNASQPPTIEITSAFLAPPPPPISVPALDSTPNEGGEAQLQEQKALAPTLPPEQIPAAGQ